MDNYGKQEKIFAHNLPDGERYAVRVKKLINTAKLLGGTIYDVAVDSGLISAVEFVESQIESQISERTIYPENMTLVTEVYVQFPWNEPSERIFLYSDNAGKDKELLKEGTIRNRRLYIPFDKLSELHARGYRCIYCRKPDGHNGKSFARYNSIFGSYRKMVPFDMWQNYPFIGNGFNQALLLDSMFETLFVMADIYIVQESIKTFYAENFIRESEGANCCDFAIERIYMQDERVFSLLTDVNELFMGERYQDICEYYPDSYQRLAYQIAYIKTYYPDVYERVWSADFEADDEKFCPFPCCMTSATVGISLNQDVSYGVCRLEDGSLKRIPNMNCEQEIPLLGKYKFKGYGAAVNAGAAGSRMALVIKDIIQSMEFMLDIGVDKIFVTHIGELPDKLAIKVHMERRIARAKTRGEEETDSGLIAYAQIADRDMDGEDVLKWAMELTNFSNIKYVPYIDSVVAAFEWPDELSRLKVEEPVMLYEFSEARLVVTILKKTQSGEIEILAQCQNSSPEIAIYEEKELNDEYNPSLLEVLEDDLEDFMLQSGLEAIGITEEGDSTAFQRLKSHGKDVKRYLRRMNSVEVIFENGYMTMSEEYPIERLEKCFEPILKESAAMIQKTLDKADLTANDIFQVLVTGEETEYPFIRSHVTKIMGKYVRSVNMAGCVAARGAALRDD